MIQKIDVGLTKIDKIYQSGEFPDIEKELKSKIRIKSFGPKCNEKELVFCLQ